MRAHRLFSALFLLVLIPLLLLVSQRTTVAVDWQAKVDASVLADVAEWDSAEFMLYLNEQADLSGADLLGSKAAKGEYVFDQLTQTASRTQQAILNELNVLGVPHRSFWITNMIWVQADGVTLARLAQRADVAHVYANRDSFFDTPLVDRVPGAIPQNDVAWGVQRVNAPEVWEMGIRGEGVIVAGADTGYAWDHPSLINSYLGWDGAAVNHDYAWYDAISTANGYTETDGGDCGVDSAEPCDDWGFGHGTHTMGTMVGLDGKEAIGVAPDAKWIACRNMNVGNGQPLSYASCFEWFIAPTDSNGENADPLRAPHIINNSWSCIVSEGCEDVDILRDVVENVRAAGIVPVSAASNTGPSCSSVNTPAALYDASLSVGATAFNDVIAAFSSRGPVTIDGSNRLKPDIAAPGSGIRSAYRSGVYGNASGTSMAAPHVAGVIALIISANPTLAGNVDVIEQILFDSAESLFSDQDCGEFLGSESPNAVFGYGMVDAKKAVELAQTKYAAPTATLTIGTAPSTCGTNTKLELAGPTDVTFCYTVTNNAQISLTNHTISTPFDGIILNITETIGISDTYSFTRTVLVDGGLTASASWTASNPALPLSMTVLTNPVTIVQHRVLLPIVTR